MCTSISQLSHMRRAICEEKKVAAHSASVRRIGFAEHVLRHATCLGGPLRAGPSHSLDALGTTGPRASNRWISSIYEATFQRDFHLCKYTASSLNRRYFVTSCVFRWLHYLSILFFRMGEYQVLTASYYCPGNLYHEKNCSSSLMNLCFSDERGEGSDGERYRERERERACVR